MRDIIELKPLTEHSPLERKGNYKDPAARTFSSLARTTVRMRTMAPYQQQPMSTWSGIQMGPPDPILGVSEAFKVRQFGVLELTILC